MQCEGLIAFLLIQLIAIATEPYYAAITCRHCFCADSTSNLVEWNKNLYSTIFNSLNRNRGLQQKTLRITHTYEYPVPQKKDDSRIYCLIDIQTIIKL